MSKRFLVSGFAGLLVLGIGFEVPAQEEVTEELLFTEIPIVVTAARKEQKLAEAPSITTVITAQMIEHMGARNFEDILRTVAGFSVGQFDTHQDVRIGIRGFSSDNNEVKIMINGHSLRSFSGGPAHYFNFLPVENIKQIEIIRGPGSALYGTNALIGVINIITKDEMDATMKTTVKAGSSNTVKPSMELSYKNNDFKTYFYADYYKTDGPKLDVESDLATKLFGPANSAAPGKTASNAEYVTFYTNASYKDFGFQGFFHRQFDTNCHISVSKALTDENKENIEAYFGELKYERELFEKANVSVKTYYDAHHFNALYETFSEETAAFLGGFPAGEGVHSGPEGTYTLRGGEATLEYRLSSAINLLGGASYEHVHWGKLKHFFNANVTGAPIVIDGTTYLPYQYIGPIRDYSALYNWCKPAERNITALYGQGIIDLKDLMSLENIGRDLVLTTGLRYDNYDDVGDTVNPRAGLVYDPTSKLSLKILYGTAFRAPSFQELYMINNPAFTGNPDLNPEKITTWELYSGYNFNKNLISSITFFDSKIKDRLEVVNKLHKNVGKIQSRGAESEFRYSFGEKEYGYLNLTFQDVKNITHNTITSSNGTTYTQKDFNPGSIPDIIGNVGINYNFGRNILANLSLNYLSKIKRSEEKKFDDPSDNLVLVDQRDDIDSRTLANLSLTLENLNFLKDLEIQIAVFNIFNQDHRDPEPSNTIANDIPRPGRTYAAKVSYTF